MRINIKEILDDNTSGSFTITENTLQIFDEYVDYATKSNIDINEVFDEIHSSAKQLVKQQPNMALLRKYIYGLVTSFKRLLSSDKKRAEILDLLAEKIKSSQQNLIKDIETISSNGAKVITNFNKILTYSNSTVVKSLFLRAIEMNRKFEVFCVKSDPPNEGVSLAEELVDLNIKTSLVADSQAGTIIDDMNLVLLGADRVYETGFVNKAGSLSICLLAAHFNIPVYLAVETSKILKESERLIKKVEKDTREIYSGEKDIEVFNSYYEKIPLNLVSKVISEEGVFETAEFLSWYLGENDG